MQAALVMCCDAEEVLFYKVQRWRLSRYLAMITRKYNQRVANASIVCSEFFGHAHCGAERFEGLNSFGDKQGWSADGGELAPCQHSLDTLPVPNVATSKWPVANCDRK